MLAHSVRGYNPLKRVRGIGNVNCHTYLERSELHGRVITLAGTHQRVTGAGRVRPHHVRGRTSTRIARVHRAGTGMTRTCPRGRARPRSDHGRLVPWPSMARLDQVWHRSAILVEEWSGWPCGVLQGPQRRNLGWSTGVLHSAVVGRKRNVTLQSRSGI